MKRCRRLGRHEIGQDRRRRGLTALAPELHRRRAWQPRCRKTKRSRPIRRRSQDGPLLDLSDAAVKKMIKVAKKRGYVTYDELNSVLPSEEVASEQIEDIMAMLSDMGINVVEDDEVEEAEETEPTKPEASELAEPAAPTAVAAKPAREPTDRTDDPVRMYLREMGSVELLSREGEIAIAKRIEAGRETMIAGLCEKPADLPGHHHLARRARTKRRSCCATSSTSRRPMPGPTPSTCRRRRRKARPGRRRANGHAQPGTPARPPGAAGRGQPACKPTATSIDEVGGRAPAHPGRGGRGRRVRERPVARGDGGRAQAAGGRDLRPSPTPTRSCASCRTSTSRSG